VSGLLSVNGALEIVLLRVRWRRRTESYACPDFDRVLASMRENRHFTLQQAWSRYLASGTAIGGKKIGYSQYCAVFAEHARVTDVVATLHNEPGRAMLVNWAGGHPVGHRGGDRGLPIRGGAAVFRGGVLSWLHGHDIGVLIAAHVVVFPFYGGGPAAGRPGQSSDLDPPAKAGREGPRAQPPVSAAGRALLDGHRARPAENAPATRPRPSRR
jgi:hypothetical protein